MPTGWRRISTGWTGPTASRRCSATGLAAAPAPRSIFSSATSRRPAASHPQEFKAWRNDRGSPAAFRPSRRRCAPRSLPPAPTRCSAPPTWSWPRSIRWSADSRQPDRAEAVQAYCEQAARKSDLDRTDLAKQKTGVFTGSFAANPVEQSPGADLGGRLRAGQLRHRRHHGRAGSRHPRLRIRPPVRPADRAGGRSRRRPLTIATRGRAGRNCRLHRRGDGYQFQRLTTGQSTAEMERPDRGRSGPAWPGARGRSTTSSAIGCSAGNIFGASRFRSCTSWTRPASPPACCGSCPPNGCRSICPSWSISIARQPRTAFGSSPESWLYQVIDGRRYKRETNTMPQWAGSSGLRSPYAPRAHRSSRGFSLIELVVVIAILGVLAAVALRRYISASASPRVPAPSTGWQVRSIPPYRWSVPLRQSRALALPAPYRVSPSSPWQTARRFACGTAIRIAGAMV